MLRSTSMLSLTAALLLPVISAAQPNGMPVEIETVRTASIAEEVRLTGTVTAARASNLSPATTGLVTELTVDAGSRVSTGDVLLALDAELARWQAQSAAAAEQAAQVALRDARRRLAEARALIPQRSIAESVVHDLVAEVAEDEAALQQAEAESGYRRAILDRHQLRAPYDGVIAAKLTDVGEWIVPGDAVLELVATEDLRIEFAVAEKYMQRIRPGATVRFGPGSSRQQSYQGTVAAVVPVSDPGARTFLLRVDPDQGSAELSPGMSVHGHIVLDADRSAPVVPRDAIIRYPDGRVIVWVVEQTGGNAVVKERLVTPGLTFDGLAEIRSGLAAGTLVVVRGNEALQSGQRVDVVVPPAD